MAEDNPKLQAALLQLDQELEVWFRPCAHLEKLLHCLSFVEGRKLTVFWIGRRHHRERVRPVHVDSKAL